MINQNEKKKKYELKGTQTDKFKVIPQIDENIKIKLKSKLEYKKRGKDVSTQINKSDFFNFTNEVTPIVQILTSKILQQSSIEVYEEEMISKMKNYKNEIYSKTKTEIIQENKRGQIN